MTKIKITTIKNKQEDKQKNKPVLVKVKQSKSACASCGGCANK